jgi:hypothetical protein
MQSDCTWMASLRQDAYSVLLPVNKGAAANHQDEEMFFVGSMLDNTIVGGFMPGPNLRVRRDGVIHYLC